MDIKEIKEMFFGKHKDGELVKIKTNNGKTLIVSVKPSKIVFEEYFGGDKFYVNAFFSCDGSFRSLNPYEAVVPFNPHDITELTIASQTDAEFVADMLKKRKFIFSRHRITNKPYELCGYQEDETFAISNATNEELYVNKIDWENETIEASDATTAKLITPFGTLANVEVQIPNTMKIYTFNEYTNKMGMISATIQEWTNYTKVAQSLLAEPKTNVYKAKIKKIINAYIQSVKQ